jgi:hypothetical protein
LVCACASKQVNLSDVYVTNEIKAKPLPVDRLSIEGEVVERQKVTVKYALGEVSINNDFIGILKLSSKQITLAVLNSFGRILTVDYTQDGISYEASPFLPLPDKFTPEYILFDIQLIYYSVDTLNRFLPKNLKIYETVDSGLRSRKLCNDDDCFIYIEYKDGSLSFKNELRKYSYILEKIQ